MDAREAHIKFFQDAERIDGYVHEDLQPNEVDLIMNTAMQRFIDDNVRRNLRQPKQFQLEQPDVDDLEFIIEKDVELPLILDDTRELGYATLPDNYMYLLNDRTRLKKDCNNQGLQTVEGEEFLVVIPLKESTLESSPFYSTVSLTLEDTVIFDISTFPEYYSNGLPEKEQIFEIKNLMVDFLRDNRGEFINEVYWETYGTSYYPYSLILKLSRPLDTNLTNSLNVDNVLTPLETTIITGLTYLEEDFEQEVSNRLIKTEMLYDVNKNNAYTSTYYKSPISTLSGNRIYVFFDKKFKPKSVVIDYIRIPRQFNVFLNQTFEIKGTFHSRIIDLAVENFKNTTEKASAYDLKVKDNLLRRE